MGEPASGPPDRLYPRVSPSWIVIATLLVLGAVILLLVTGGEDAPEEARGDLTYLEGSVPNNAAQGSAQLVASIADVTEGKVSADGDTILFEATVAAPVPQSLKTSALEFRWDISGEGTPTWTLTVAMDEDARASLFSDEGYGAGTVDDTFPGELMIDGTKIEVRLDAAEIENFPEEFKWRLGTTLRAFRDETDSPRVEDHYPDEGSQEFEL